MRRTVIETVRFKEFNGCVKECYLVEKQSRFRKFMMEQVMTRAASAALRLAYALHNFTMRLFAALEEPVAAVALLDPDRVKIGGRHLARGCIYAAAFLAVGIVGVIHPRSGLKLSEKIENYLNSKKLFSNQNNDLQITKCADRTAKILSPFRGFCRGASKLANSTAALLSLPFDKSLSVASTWDVFTSTFEYPCYGLRGIFSRRYREEHLELTSE